MNRCNSRLPAVAIACLALAGTTTLVPLRQACAQPQPLSYSQDIVPIFKGYCVACHQSGGEGYKASGFDLTTYEGLMKGTRLGPMVIPGQPDVSNLVVLVEGRASPQIRMPYKHRLLPSCLRGEIYSWVFQGAKNN